MKIILNITSTSKQMVVIIDILDGLILQLKFINKNLLFSISSFPFYQ